jgi:hypothetical protein
MKLFGLKDGNDTNQKFNECALLPIALILACFAISLMVQAVLPAPGERYPGGNTAEGGPPASETLARSQMSTPGDAGRALSSGVSALSSPAQTAISAALGQDDLGYHADATIDGYRVDNPAQRLVARFTRDGVTICTTAGHWGLRLTSYGYGDLRKAAAPAVPKADANRVAYQRGALTEWYVNGPAGLEQGFTLAAAPGGGHGEPLTFRLAVEGNLQAVVEAGAQRLTLAKADGTAVLRYGGLMVFDAAGHAIPAWLEATGKEVLLRVADRGARYPLLIDPFVQQAKLTASDGASNDWFGLSVAMSGDTVIVGAPLATVGVHSFQGAAYVFVKPAAGWTTTSAFTAKLTASDGNAGDHFGYAVAISGDTVVAGADNATVGANASQGAAYVFVKPPAGWATTSSFNAKLSASDGAGPDHLGFSVAISGDTVVAGADNATVGANASQGAAYVFVRPVGGWATMTETAKLTTSDGTPLAYFGFSVTVSGDTIVVGAEGANIGPTIDQGAAYVFVKPPSGWATTSTFTAKLTASDGTQHDELGSSVAISGDTVVAGAPLADLANPNRESDQGATYVFVKPPAGWATMTETAKVTASDAANDDEFGTSVGISGDTVIVGAPRADTANPDQGAVYVFVKPVAGWTNTSTFTAKLTASDGQAADEFGFAVAIDGDFVIVGAPFHTVNGNARQGAAYVSATITIPGLISGIQNLSELNAGQQNSLIAKLQAAQAAVDRGDLNTACASLAAFVNEVNALERSGRLDQATATALVSGAQLIQASLGCP